jgi:hypothetical protein
VNDLTTYIDIDLMIAAGLDLGLRSEAIDTARVAMYNPMTYLGDFGGSGGEPDYPTSFTTGGVTGSGFLWWDGPTYMESETFSVESDAPWAPELHQKWDDSVRHRGAEAFAVQSELAGLKLCIMQYLQDTGVVDLDNAGLLEDTVG